MAETRWARQAVKESAEGIRQALDAIGSVPEALQEWAPDVWAAEVLKHITEVRHLAEWCSRALIEQSSIPQREVAAIADVAPSTVNIWRNSPVTLTGLGPEAVRAADGRRRALRG